MLRPALLEPRRYSPTTKANEDIHIQTALSLISSISLAARPLLTGSSSSRLTFLVLGVANVAACFGAQAHVAGYWKGKAKIPFVKKYNEAIGGTNLVRVFLGYLGWGWVLVGGLGTVVGS